MNSIVEPKLEVIIVERGTYEFCKQYTGPTQKNKESALLSKPTLRISVWFV